ncbi:hypothetical protein HF086_012104 [Spodoptera exigua]|uniref:Secreted protein n=1 Tax=Spodoptera exigua TaxID=7107 RepID=A0A922MA76_SPOEX|nr:hypothetical protein HF086_012104 [Spodoptera exigua]
MWCGSACASWVCLSSGATPGGGSGSSATPSVAGPHRTRTTADQLTISKITIFFGYLETTVYSLQEINSVITCSGTHPDGRSAGASTRVQSIQWNKRSWGS